MGLLKKLHTPVALVAQGFLAGATLFLATHPGSADSLADSLARTAALVNGAAASL